MGELYEYTCEECGSTAKYRTGGGFCTPDYFKKTELLQKELEDEILAGKYGIMLKTTLEECNGDLCIYCGTELFECDNYKCRYTDVLHDKRISNFPYLRLKYTMEINMFIDCPKCENGKMRKVSPRGAIWCKKCQRYSMIGGLIGFWD